MAQLTSRSEAEPAKQRILFVEDDPELCRFLGRYFTGEGYQVDLCHDGAGLRQLLAQATYDLVVMDVGLPGRDDGYALAREIRGHFRGGLLFLSGRQEAIDRIVGLEIGADDFLVKPFEPRELLSRVRAILRRMPIAASAPPDDTRTACFDGWSLDFEARTLRDKTGRVRELTTQEFNLLSALAQRPGRVLSRDQLLDLVSSRDWSPFDRSIDVMIGKIRRKIGDTGPDHRMIRTIRGAGYMFSPSR